MISTGEAKRLILQAVRRRPLEERFISSAVGCVLGADVVSPVPLPLFNNSAMDGYALRSADTATASEEHPVTFTSMGVVSAEELTTQLPDLQANQCFQIFTGAMVPPSADAVIRQEDVVVCGDTIVISRPVKQKENIRFQGEEVQVDDIVLTAGSVITPAGIGILASLGMANVSIGSTPRVGLLVTGSEIAELKDALQPGKIYDSNSHVLAAALHQMHIQPTFRETCVDNRSMLRQKVNDALDSCDILLVTGGVSVGKFDYVKEIAQEAGIEEIFWKVRQKPGKPLYFGATADRSKLLFGLPGNPASVLVSFYEYVRPAIMKSMGAAESSLVTISAVLRHDYTKNAGLTQFLKGKLHSDGTVEILERQGSHMMSSFAYANCLLTIAETATICKKGDKVEVHLLPV